MHRDGYTLDIFRHHIIHIVAFLSKLLMMSRSRSWELLPLGYESFRLSIYYNAYIYYTNTRSKRGEKRTILFLTGFYGTSTRESMMKRGDVGVA